MVRASKRDWKTVQLPEELLSQVDEIVNIPSLGYTSRSEFIKEAVRLRIVEVEEYLTRKAQREGNKS